MEPPHSTEESNGNPDLKVEVERVFGLAEFKDSELEPAANKLDQCLVAILSGWSQKKPIFLYLAECYSRALQAADKVLAKRIEYLVVSYAGLALSNPDMFPQSPEAMSKGQTLFTDVLLKTGTRIINVDFVNALVERWKDDELQEVLLNPIFNGLAELLNARQLNVESDLEALFTLFHTLVSFQSLFNSYLTSPLWISSEWKENEFEFRHPIGLLVRIYLLDDPTLTKVKQYIKVENERVVNNLEDAYSTLRSMTLPYLANLHRLFYSFVKLNRIKTIEFFFRMLKVGNGYRKMHWEPEEVCSEGLCFNFNYILLKLCEPFLGNQSKLPLINSDFYSIYSEQFPDAMESTKLNCTQAEFQEHTKQFHDTTANFITEAFFLCAEFFHIGIVRIMNQTMEEAVKAEEIKSAIIPRITQQLDSLPAGNPVRYVCEMHLRQFRTKLDDFIVRLAAMGTWLMEDEFIGLCYSYFSYRIKWLMNLGVMQIKFLPEYFLKDTLDFFTYNLKLNPRANAKHMNCDELFDFLVYVFSAPGLLKNPYLKGSIVELFFTIITLNERSITSAFVSNGAVQDSLMNALMDFYVQVEYTGMSTQFYDKFRIRFHISRIFKFLWEQSRDQRDKVRSLSKSNPDLFTKFVNYLHGDVSYVLGESLDKLVSINQLQNQLANPSVQPGNEQRNDEQTLASLERTCTSCMNLAVENLDLLALVSSEIVAPFIRAEIVDRLAAMLNYNLAILVGPKCSSLKVRNPERYNFEPLKLLGLFMDIYNHLACKTFALALAHDERSFSQDNMKRHTTLVRTRGIRSGAECDKYSRLIDAVLRLKESSREEQQEMGEIPDEFLDPLMCTLMRDPVILPTSRVTIDRATIVTQLLNNPVDPFNRSPLTIEQVIPNDELKGRIDEFLKRTKTR